MVSVSSEMRLRISPAGWGSKYPTGRRWLQWLKISARMEYVTLRLMVIMTDREQIGQGRRSGVEHQHPEGIPAHLGQNPPRPGRPPCCSMALPDSMGASSASRLEAEVWASASRIPAQRNRIR